MPLTFSKSKELTLGVEVEVQLVDRDTLALAPASTKIIDGLGGYNGAVKHELMMSNLEIITKVCGSVQEVADDLYGTFNAAIAEAARHDILICGAGTHPFSTWKEQKLTPDARYKRLLFSLGGVARRFNIFGLHVHVGIGDGEKCIYVMNRMLYYLPHLLALSSNSPFWEGEDTALKSFRTVVFGTLPTAGLPFYFNDWDDYARLIDCFISTRTIETIREIWWDARPHPDLGTIEIRICDTPATVADALAITALIQALVARFCREYERGMPYARLPSHVIRQNKWRASRYGLDGEFITEAGDRTVKAREAIGELIKSLYKEAGELGSTEYLALAEQLVTRGDGASRQLDVWRLEGDLQRVVLYLAHELENDVKAGSSMR
ncbi:MAG: carboxylate-amine ligase [Nitrospirota bacterium]|nr:carboxylate-amine ligase [Nitrospirota bacterium]